MLEELLFRSLCDTLPDAPLDGHFLYGQTPDNEASVFAAAHYLLQNKKASRILITNTGPMSGFRGFSNWQDKLVEQGVAAAHVVPVPPVPRETPILHTLIEAQSMVAFAKEQQLKSIVVTAAPFQQPRAFMTAVTAALASYPELRIYSYPGNAMPWQDEVVHSQGTVTGTRASLIAGELERVALYNAKGDLASVQEVLAYLNQRDKNLL
ncbi:YdcF family protein [Pontibacter qinzhouensis]|uniref:YdcF family protein n=1 Tax=Pontibacter qinzhouensis TaxID=2603253 RepID=A0A5C8JH42_9BACT|nr:YdcF family protein [Pontibacter qinzhouensis]TXK36701.1 YdcF family protein [Pontibacter qinzhouensis]